MSNSSTLGRPPAGEASSYFDQLERKLAETLARAQPGRSSLDAVSQLRKRLVGQGVFLALDGKAFRSGSFSRTTKADTKKGLAATPIDAALTKSTLAHVKALSKAGMPPAVLELLQSLLEVTVDARLLQQNIEFLRALEGSGPVAISVAPGSLAVDPLEPLSAADLGRALGELSDETVRQREKAGELFSVLRPGRKRGREYPAFQAWPGIAGEPLAKVLSALTPGSSTVAYGFFSSPTDLLGGLTPVEALLGRLTDQRELDAETQALMNAPTGERLHAVVKAAEAHAAMLAA